MPKHNKKSRNVKPKLLKISNTHADENTSPRINIGLSNISKWNQLKKQLYLETDEAFVAHLLKTLEGLLSKQNENKAKVESSQRHTGAIEISRNFSSKDSFSSDIHNIDVNLSAGREQIQIENTQETDRPTSEIHDGSSLASHPIKNDGNNPASVFENSTHEEALAVDMHEIKHHEPELAFQNPASPVSKHSPSPISSENQRNLNDIAEMSTAVEPPNSTAKPNILSRGSNMSRKAQKRRDKFALARTNLNAQANASLVRKSRSEKEGSKVGGSSKKPCPYCNQLHQGTVCPVFCPIKRIKDSISHEDWIKGDVFVHSNSVCDSDEELNFSKCSLPECLELKSIKSSHDYSVVARLQIPQFTEFGPLIGEPIKMQDIPDDCNMHSIWEVQDNDGKLFYLSTENLNLSNWLSHIRPAPSLETSNVSIVTRDSQLYFVSTATIVTGSELLYWTDNIAKVWDDKKVNKKNCGGCNIKFNHIFYYRLHCQIFHDANCSLTVRKYHCKVCGAAVLGKQNIVKHAAELHRGKGAYQCPFCKKFFLRLNYLDMHKTYGCSSNPQRLRPLCDFCGRKFCQPQKLKVHIKRMHGDISSILAEFQCMSCLRVLGSRAALQRHNKEVHHKSERVSFTCQQCGKGFQNKSNLKIHMLTHSGIKPFRCSVAECSSAFTTKQCLQLHYKKFHGLSDENMPKIHRTVEYTFNAYAGENLSDSQAGSPQSCENSDSQCQTPTSPSPSEISSKNRRLSSPVNMTSHDETDISSNQYNVAVNCSSNFDEQSDSAHSSSVIMKSSVKGYHEEIVSEIREKPSMLPLSSECETEIENKGLYPYGRTDSSNASLLVEAAIDAVEKVINVDHSPINFTITHDPAGVPAGMDHDDEQRGVSSQSPVLMPPFNLSVHPESQSSSLDISISSAYHDEITPPHYGAPYSLHLSPVDVVRVAEQNENYLHKTDDMSGDECENPVQNLCLSSKDRLQIDVLAYKSYPESIEEKSSLLKQYENRDRLPFLKHYSPLDDRGLKYDPLDERLISASEERLNLFKQYELLEERSPTLLKQYDVMEERSSLYKLYDNGTDERGFSFESLESADLSRCPALGHIYSNLQVSPPKYPRPLYGTNPSHAYSDVLRVVNLHSQSVDLSLPRPPATNLIPSSPTYQSYPLSPTLPTYLTPRSALSPTYHPYSGYY
ncbi:uncharacterized protein [Bemisia tabaci]|uniref:uncharacterized protein isoform X2 n=1 Tax=Bemisia tabaci TaxID=7038 RepID=UPI003B2863E9